MFRLNLKSFLLVAAIGLITTMGSALALNGGENSKLDEKIDALSVELFDSQEGGKDQNEVIAALQKLLKGLADRNVEEVGDCLSGDVTMFDSKTDKYLYGKDAVIEHVRKNVIGTAGQHPVKKISVFHPFVTVRGDTAMVSFRATKELGDPNSTKMESWCSEVFERKNGQWLVLQLKTDWKVVAQKGR